MGEDLNSPWGVPEALFPVQMLRELEVMVTDRERLREIIDRVLEMAILNFHNGTSGDTTRDLVKWLGLTEDEYRRWVDDGARGLPL